MQLFYTSKPSMVKGPCDIDRMFTSPTAFEVCVRNQEEADLLYAYSLVYGREIKVEIFSHHWVVEKSPNSPTGPTLYTTWDPRVPGIYLKGVPGFETHPEPVRAQYMI